MQKKRSPRSLISELISPTNSRHAAVSLSQLNTYSRRPAELSRKPGAHFARTIITMQIPFVVSVCRHHFLPQQPPNTTRSHNPLRRRICAPAPFQTCLRHCHLQANHSDFSITTNANGFYRRVEPAKPRASAASVRNTTREDGARRRRRRHATAATAAAPHRRRELMNSYQNDDGIGLRELRHYI